MDFLGLSNRIDLSSLIFPGDRRSEMRKPDGVSFLVILKRNTVENFSSLELEPFTVSFTGLYLGGFFWRCESHDVNRLENRMTERFLWLSVKIKWAYYIEKYKKAKENVGIFSEPPFYREN